MGDVAAAAGVSQQTVSRVVNNSDAVRKKTVDKVLKAMTEVGYSPNVAARSLRSGRTSAIGVLATDLSRTGELRTVQAIVDATRRSELAVVLVELHFRQLDVGVEMGKQLQVTCEWPGCGGEKYPAVRGEP